jgi:LacI family transcriptional regulator
MNLKQLAKQLNLSTSTVSKALRDSYEISSRTKEAVLAKAKELNFQVNPYASSLRQHRSQTIAVVTPEVVHDFFSSSINGIESIAQEKGYHVLIYLSHEDTQKEVAILKLIQSGRVDGVVLTLSENTSDLTHLAELKQKDIPLVLLDRVAEYPDAPKVTTDDFNCGLKGTELLIERGCKRIAFLFISKNASTSQKRMIGYQEAHRKHKLKQDNSLILPCVRNDIKCKELIRKLLKRKNRPDAILATVEKLVINIYEVCAELNLKIPRDIKIICFSNLRAASLLNPPLTTISQPGFDMGRVAASMLFKMIEKKDHHFLNERTVLNSIFMERESSMGNYRSKRNISAKSTL